MQQGQAAASSSSASVRAGGGILPVAQAASAANLSTLQAQTGASAALHPQAVPAQGMSAAVVPATRPVMVTVDPSRHSSLPSHAAQQLQHTQSNLSSEHPTKG